MVKIDNFCLFSDFCTAKISQKPAILTPFGRQASQYYPSNQHLELLKLSSLPKVLNFYEKWNLKHIFLILGEILIFKIFFWAGNGRKPVKRPDFKHFLSLGVISSVEEFR